MMKSVDVNGNARGGVDDATAVETKYMADESGGGKHRERRAFTMLSGILLILGTLVIHEKKNRVTVRVVYTREFVLQCAASPFTSLTPAGLPWMSRETPEILRPVRRM